MLERGTFDNLNYFKVLCLRVVGDLLSAKPEGEQRLLEVLVNKLGDPSRKVAAKTTYILTQLVQAHPAMRGVVARAAAVRSCAAPLRASESRGHNGGALPSPPAHCQRGCVPPFFRARLSGPVQGGTRREALIHTVGRPPPSRPL